MLMAIELMNALRVRRWCVDEVILCPIATRPLKTGNRIAMPIDGCAKVNIVVTKEIHTMLAQHACLPDCALQPSRIPAPHDVCHTPPVASGSVEAAKRSMREVAF